MRHLPKNSISPPFIFWQPFFFWSGILPTAPFLQMEQLASGVRHFTSQCDFRSQCGPSQLQGIIDEVPRSLGVLGSLGALGSLGVLGSLGPIER
jgi:hypothetical protein